MAEPKPVASLSSGLLARKGAARPAMRRQGVGQGFGGLMPQPLPHDDLGWDDMGYDVDPPVDAPLHDEGVPHYGHMLSGAIPDAVPAAADVPQEWEAPEPVVPDVVRQQAEIAERMAEPEQFDPEQFDLGPVTESLPALVEPEAQVLSVKKRKPAAVVAQPAAAAVAPTVAPAAHGRRAAFTLRLDSERHLKLRLASAVTGMSAQQLVTAALDEFLTKIPEIDDLAGRVPRPAAR